MCHPVQELPEAAVSRRGGVLVLHAQEQSGLREEGKHEL